MRTRSRIVSAVLVGLLVAVVTAGCGDDDDDDDDAAATTTTTAEQAVCEAGDELRTSVDAVVSDVGDGNLSEAQEGVGAIGSAAEDLGDTLGNLAADVRDEIEPLVDDIRDEVSSLGDSASLEDLGTSLGSIGS